MSKLGGGDHRVEYDRRDLSKGMGWMNRKGTGVADYGVVSFEHVVQLNAHAST